MKLVTLLLAAIIPLSVQAHSGSHPGYSDLGPEDYSLPDRLNLPANQYNAYISQQGSAQRAAIMQNGMGANSYAIIQQQGGQNSADITQSYGANDLAIISQSGWGNDAQIIQQGSGNSDRNFARRRAELRKNCSGW